MTKLILHIGTHKTGTTSIQGFFDGNRKALQAQGFDYPSLKKFWPHISSHRNAYFLTKKAVFLSKGKPLSEYAHADLVAANEANFAKALKAAEGKRTIIASDERLWYSGALYDGFWEHVRSLCESYGATEFQIICYLRRQDAMAEALWNQYVKANNRITEDLWSYVNHSGVKKICNYKRGVERLEKVFGRDAITLRIFDRSQLEQGDVIRDIVGLLGIDYNDSFKAPEEDLNTRLSGNQVEIKRLINFSPDYKDCDNFLIEPGRYATEASTEEPTSPYTAEQRAEYLGRYEKGNAWIARNYFGSEAPLFKASSKDNLPAWSDTLTEVDRDIIRLFAQALTQEHKRVLELEARVAKLEASKAPVQTAAREKGRKLFGH